METKHTPEPWDVQNKGHLYGPSARHEVVNGINIDGSKNLPTICRMPDLSEQSYANARLIAAAPDLLAACRAALDLISDLDPHGLNTGTYDQIAAALAKAAGSL